MLKRIVYDTYDHSLSSVGYIKMINVVLIVCLNKFSIQHKENLKFFGKRTNIRACLISYLMNMEILKCVL